MGPTETTPASKKPKRQTVEESEEANKEPESEESEDVEESEHSDVEMSESEEGKEEPLWKGMLQKLLPYNVGKKFKVMVWYNDTKEWYLGEVTDYKKSKDLYLVSWLEVDESDEWIDLLSENHTTGKHKNFVI